MTPAILIKNEEKHVTLDPQIVERFGMIYDGDLSITISMVIFIGLAVLAFFWARMYPDNRHNPNKEFVVFLLDPNTGPTGKETGSPNPPDDNNNPL